VTPVLGIVMSLFVLYSMGLPALERILAWQVVGFVVYLSIKRGRRAALASAG
jgi:hypothetical protein